MTIVDLTTHHSKRFCHMGVSSSSSWCRLRCVLRMRSFDVGDYYVLSKLSYFLYINLVSGLAADILIATSLCLFLSRHQTGSSRTNSIVRLLMVYSINTGILTSLCAFACLIIYAVLPLSKKFAFSAIYFVLPKLLLNALLATLNARQGLREKSATGVVPISLAAPSDSHFTDNNGSEYSQPRERQLVEIQAQTTTDVRLECIPYVIEKGSGTYTPPAPLFATADTYAI
ncbi:hypothetical protein AcV5_003243 [Taiwanofungus camphoratus]|nr:hypothetical protein AcV5_003243 [Antrodia cinnamomea]